jgi:hypothetical protein
MKPRESLEVVVVASRHNDVVDFQYLQWLSKMSECRMQMGGNDDLPFDIAGWQVAVVAVFQ